MLRGSGMGWPTWRWLHGWSWRSTSGYIWLLCKTSKHEWYGELLMHVWKNMAKLCKTEKKHVGLKLLVAIRNVPELVEGIISSFTMFYPIVAKNKHGFNHGFKRWFSLPPIHWFTNPSHPFDPMFQWWPKIPIWFYGSMLFDLERMV